MVWLLGAASMAIAIKALEEAVAAATKPIAKAETAREVDKKVAETASVEQILREYPILNEFCHSGEVDVDESMSKLFFRVDERRSGVMDISNLSNEGVEALLKKTKQASFGLGMKEVTDLEVRAARDIKKEDFAFQFDPLQNAEIFRSIEWMLSSREFTLEPYKLNVYQKGGHFKKHKDTLRGHNMIASLVVCLPSRFEGGELTVSDGNGTTVTLAWGGEANARKIKWACFFTDCDHEIAPVTEGNRITIVYHVFTASSSSGDVKSKGKAKLQDFFAQLSPSSEA